MEHELAAKSPDAVRVLIVEDDAAQRKALAAILRRGGFTVTSCGTVADARRCLAQEDFAVAVVDLVLPESGGMSLLEDPPQAHATPPRVIIHSGQATFAAARDALNLRAFAFIEKLSSPHELISAVNKAAQDYLRASLSKAADQIRFQVGLLDAVQQSVVATSPDGAVIYWNAFAESLFGWSSEEARGRPILDLVVPEDRRPDGEAIMALLQQGQAWNGEFTVVSRHGRRFPIEVTNSPIIDADGRLTGIIGIASDITARKEAESLLRLKQVAIDSADTMIFWVTPDGTFLDVNQSACRSLGYPRDALLARTVFDVFRGLTTAQWDHDRADLRRRAVMQQECDFLRSDGSRFPVEVCGHHFSCEQTESFCLIVRDITTRRATEQALQRSVELLRDAQHMARMGNWELDPRTGDMSWSPELYDLLQCDLQTPATLRHLLDRIAPEQREAVARELQHSARHERVTVFRCRTQRRNGTVRTLETHCRSTPATGAPPSIRGLCLDITDRVAEEQRFRGMLEGAPDAMVICDTDGRIVLVNRQAEQLFGYTTDELTGQPVEKLVPVALRDRHVALRQNYVRRPMHRRNQADQVLQGQRKDGSVFPAEISLNPLRLPDGLLVTAAIRDVSERERMHAEVRRGRELLDEAQRVASIGSWEWNIAANRVWWSDHLLDMYGLAGASAPQSLQEFLSHVLPDDRHELSRRIHRAVGTGSTYHARFRVVSPDGTIRHHVAQGKVERDETGRAVRLLGTDLDITEQHQTELQLRRAERLGSLGTLAAGLAHELNNPLSAILIATETASQFRDERELQDQSLDTIRHSIQRCQEIIRNVLRFARNRESDKRATDINDVVRNAITTTQHYAQLSGSTIAFRAGTGLPPVHANPGEIEQVVVNLIRNAIQAGPRTRIDIATLMNAESDFLCIEVSDDGRGIPDSDLQQVFDPFFTRNIDEGGTGLGLAVSHGIICDHCGQIEVRSRPGYGTTFTVTLPPHTPDCIR